MYPVDRLANDSLLAFLARIQEIPSVVTADNFSRENFATVRSNPCDNLQALTSVSEREIVELLPPFVRTMLLSPLGSKAWVLSFSVRQRCTWVLYEALGRLARGLPIFF